MKSIPLSIPLAIGLSFMCILCGAGFAGCDGATAADEAVPGRAFQIRYSQELTLKGRLQRKRAQFFERKLTLFKGLPLSGIEGGIALLAEFSILTVFQDGLGC